MSNVVCITGMHRSGTSLTASWLQQCGLQIDNGDLINAAVGNPHGHFEDKDFVDFHSERMLALDPSSCGWIIYKKLKQYDSSTFKHRANELIDARKNIDNWGWKDPRTILFLEQWLDVLPKMKTIFVWRPAHEVVDSLIRRSKKATHPYFKITKAQAYQVWRFYNLLAIQYFEKHQETSAIMGIDQIKGQSEQVLVYLNNKLTLDLDFVDINILIDGSLMKPKKKNVSDTYFYLSYRITKIESKLKALSIDLL